MEVHRTIADVQQSCSVVGHWKLKLHRQPALFQRRRCRRNRSSSPQRWSHDNSVAMKRTPIRLGRVPALGVLVALGICVQLAASLLEDGDETGAPSVGMVADCGAPGAPPWLVQCQLELPPSERWIYTNKGRFMEINGHAMHFVDFGPKSAERVYVFLHGQPTWGYLWRNVAKFVGGCDNSDFPEFDDACDGPNIQGVARALIVDAVGFGRSDKPVIEFDDSGLTSFDYSLSSHIDQLEGLLDALGLGAENGGPEVVFVGHDWGAGFAVGYIGRRPGNVAGFVCFECTLFQGPVQTLAAPFFTSFPGSGCCGFLDQLRTRQAYDYVFKRHLWIDIFLRGLVLPGNLSDAEFEFYRFPFARPQDRWGSYHMPQNLVFGDLILPNGTKLSQYDPVPDNLEDFPPGTVFPSPSSTWLVLQRGRSVLFNTPLPKLLLTADPGFLFLPGSDNLNMFLNATAAFPDSFRGPVNIGAASHFGQEDQPENIGRSLVDWDSEVFR